MLHESLTELSAVAPKVATLPEFRGVLAESRDLMRNAISHATDSGELTAWYSRIVTDTLASPVIRSLADATACHPTGAFAQGDALPTSTVRWFPVAGDTPTAQTTDPSPAIAEAFRSAGLQAGAVGPLRDRSGWQAALQTAGDELLIAATDATDAGGWLSAAVTADPAVAQRTTDALYRQAIGHRPGALARREGLPDTEVEVDVTADLLAPIAALARWAAPEVRGTVARLRASDLPEAADLERAWVAGLRIRLARWADRVARHPVILADLPALQRSAYGAAARTLAGAIDAVAARTQQGARD